MPDNESQGGLLVFVHIPKTGGTTLNSMLAHQYPAAQAYEIMMRGMSATAAAPLISFSKIRRLKRTLRSRQMRVIHGHFDLSLGPLMPDGAQFFTFLRNPVDRAISHYFHYRNNPSDPIHALAMRADLKEWVTASGLVEMDNGQTRRLAGEMGRPVGTVTQEMLERAKTNLKKFAVVGLTERFEESQVLLRHAFSWPVCRYPARNVGERQAGGFDIDMLDAIRRHNRFDLELYAFAVELFDEAINRIDMAGERALLSAAPEYVAPPSTPPAARVPPAYRRAWSGIRSYLFASQFPRT